MARMTTDLVIKTPLPHKSTELIPILKQEKVVLCLDSSGSMGILMDNRKMRIHNATEAIREMLTISDPRRTAYGLVSFSAWAEVISPISTDWLSIQAGMYTHPDSSTRMDLGLLKSIGLLPDRIILLSDGQPTCDLDLLWAVVDRCIKVRWSIHGLIKIDTIGLGVDDEAEEILVTISNRTHGIYRKVETVKELRQSFLQLETNQRKFLVSHL